MIEGVQLSYHVKVISMLEQVLININSLNTYLLLFKKYND